MESRQLPNYDGEKGQVRAIEIEQRAVVLSTVWYVGAPSMTLDGKSPITLNGESPSTSVVRLRP